MAVGTVPALFGVGTDLQQYPLAQRILASAHSIHVSPWVVKMSQDAYAKYSPLCLRSVSYEGPGDGCKSSQCFDRFV